jgi:L-serine dehydratase
MVRLAELALLSRADRIVVHLYGSLGATGEGHGTVSAVVLGLTGAEPQFVDPDDIPRTVRRVHDSGEIELLGDHTVPFVIDRDIVLRGLETLPGHPNGIEFFAFDEAGELLWSHRSYSVGGGFVVDEDQLDITPADDSAVPYPYRSADELVAMCTNAGLTIHELKFANELVDISADDVRRQLLDIWTAMRECVERGCEHDGELPGGLGVQRRAAALHRRLATTSTDPLAALDWVNLWALAVNEENAAGGRVVTAPTNGAAGIVPAVLHYYARFVPGADDDGVVAFLLTAAAVGALFKMNASISGAEVGCQGEVGSACAMAAAGLAQVMGGTPLQVENAAEIALEHNLGLTCDPIGGLVQVPCIERNAMAAVKAINAARLALQGDGTHLVSLDQAITTMRDTGRDMHEKYKETARGGLAVTFQTASGLVPVAVSYVEC